MAGIDNNTILYLRGDSFEDLSLSPKTITNNGITISDSGVFSKSLDFTSTNNATVTLPTFLNKPFTVDWYEYDTNDVIVGQVSSIFTNVIKNTSGNVTNNYGFGMVTNSTEGDNVLDLGTNATSAWDICMNKPIGNDLPNQWVHRSIVYDGASVRSYENGIKYMELNLGGKKILSTYNTFQFNRWRESVCSSSRYIKSFRLSNIVRYTEDFIPPNYTYAYNSININVTNKTFSQIDFNVTKLGQEIVNKVEVLVNNIVSETYTDNFDNLTYNIDNSLCSIGNNKITIRVTYDDNYIEEEILTHTATVNNLPTTSSLRDVIDRQELLNNSIEIQKNNLKNILVGKNVEVTEEDKMSDLIGKVDLLGEYDDSKLWLYKDGDNLKNISKVAKNENGNGVISVSFDNECIKIINNENSPSNATSNNALSIGINSKIDISKYTKIKCEFTSIVNNYDRGKTSIVLLSSSNYTYNTWQEDYVGVFSKYKKQLGNEAKAIVECDITNINELSYISVNVVGNTLMRSASVSIHKIWLEK